MAEALRLGSLLLTNGWHTTQEEEGANLVGANSVIGEEEILRQHVADEVKMAFMRML